MSSWCYHRVTGFETLQERVSECLYGRFQKQRSCGAAPYRWPRGAVPAVCTLLMMRVMTSIGTENSSNSPRKHHLDDVSRLLFRRTVLIQVAASALERAKRAFCPPESVSGAVLSAASVSAPGPPWASKRLRRACLISVWKVAATVRRVGTTNPRVGPLQLLSGSRCTTRCERGRFSSLPASQAPPSWLEWRPVDGRGGQN
jgi:hypothetical protein